jgi:drug/metabolite transporter (DMT)-like permease
MAYLQFLFVCLSFGSNFVLMDRAAHYFGPFEIAFCRVASAAVLLAVLWATVDRKQRVRWRDVPVIVGIGVLANAYPYVIQPLLISNGFGHSFFGMTVTLNPLLTILVSIPLLGIKPTTRQMVGVLGGLVFVVLLMYEGNLRGISLGMLAMAVTVPLTYAIGNTWLSRSLSGTPPIALTCVMLLSSAAALAPFAALPSLQASLSAPVPAVRADFQLAMGSILVLGMIGTGVCIWLIVKLVQSHGPLFAGMVTYVVPVVALVWGLLDKEQITTRQVVAITGILAMVALVQAPTRQQAAATLNANDSWQGKPLPIDA